MELDQKQLIEMYHRLLRIRIFEETVVDPYTWNIRPRLGER